MRHMLITGVRPAGGVAAVDIRIAGGVVTESGPALARRHDEVLDADGRWAVPGLWDHHVHLGQLGAREGWFDTSAARTPEDLLWLVARRVAAAANPAEPLIGFGARPSLWQRSPRREELDLVSGHHLVVLVSGDAHSGWLNTAAQRRFGVSHPGPVSESEWFAIFPRLDDVSPAAETGVPAVLARAAALGIVGITDLTFAPTFETWAERVASGIDTVRVRAGFYPEHLDAALATGRRTGEPIAGLATMGPFKVITDGSLGSLTAYCDEPYGPRGDTGVQNVGRDELTALASRCAAAGLEVTFHAIGDRACAVALDALERSGAAGCLEHAQLLRRADVERLARLGVAASVQPAHLLDDLPALRSLWADRGERAYVFRSLLDAGVTLRLGSDAPVAPLDPWLAMAAAVHRNSPEDEPWHPEQRLTAAEALRCSTNAHPGFSPGAPGDVVLLTADPLAPQPHSAATAAHLLSMRRQVTTTVVAGRVVWAG